MDTPTHDSTREARTNFPFLAIGEAINITTRGTRLPVVITSSLLVGAEMNSLAPLEPVPPSSLRGISKRGEVGKERKREVLKCVQSVSHVVYLRRARRIRVTGMSEPQPALKPMSRAQTR